MRNSHRVPLAIAALILLLPATVFATAGRLMLVNDQDGCEFVDPGNMLITVHVVHRLWVQGDNVTGVRFRIESPAGASWIPVGFDSPYVTIGTVNVDLSVAYGQCVTENITVGDALWFSTAPSPACGELRMLPAQGQAVVMATDCNFTEMTIFGLGGIVNPDHACCCSCWATRQSTWGGVKALYR